MTTRHMHGRPQMARKRGLFCLALLQSMMRMVMGQHAAQAGEPPAGIPILPFSEGARLEDLPGREVLYPPGPRKETSITLTPATIQGPTNQPLMLQFTNSVYRDDASGAVHFFGPTLRLRAGDSYAITVTNNLTASGPDATEQNGFHNLANTNLHTHGLHHWPGVYSQATAKTYQGGDNIFINIPGKQAPEASPQALTITGAIPQDHMPGLHWYHAHRHGSSALQLLTASGLILVEDDPSWLPDEQGCTEVRALLEEAEDVLLHLELMTFKPADQAYIDFTLSEFKGSWEDSNPQFISEAALPQNNLCCNGTGQTVPSYPLLGSANSSDFVLVNGGYKPVITMQSGRYQRWRLVNAGYRRFLDMQIVDADTGLPTDQCEKLLLAKDGVYLLELPRLVQHIFLSNANRAELLVKCTGPAGKRYVLASGVDGASPFGEGMTNETILESTPWTPVAENLMQAEVAVIEMADAEGPPQPTPELKACVPLRPSYAADLRDPALEAFNATDLLYNDFVTFTFKNNVSCQINYKNFTFPDPSPFELPLGRIVEWQFGNSPLHPLHLHVNPFQITHLDPAFIEPGFNFSSWFEEGDYHDTLQMPMYKPLKDTNVTLRIQPGEYAGYAVMHCHRLNHEDTGCMAVVKFACPGYDEEQPSVCDNFEFPVPGTYVK